MKRLTASIALWVGTAATAFGHPFHTSMTEVEWNAESRRFEVALMLSTVTSLRALM